MLLIRVPVMNSLAVKFRLLIFQQLSGTRSTHYTWKRYHPCWINIEIGKKLKMKLWEQTMLTVTAGLLGAGLLVLVNSQPAR